MALYSMSAYPGNARDCASLYGCARGVVNMAPTSRDPFRSFNDTQMTTFKKNPASHPLKKKIKVANYIELSIIPRQTLSIKRITTEQLSPLVNFWRCEKLPFLKKLILLRLSAASSPLQMPDEENNH